MKVVIDIEDSAPPYSQLIEQIKNAVLAGELNPGEPLPSIRQLAGDLDLNHKTVAKAYRFLERDAVIESKGYRGTFVHPDARTNSAVDLAALVDGKLTEVILSLRDSGVTDTEIRNSFGRLMNSR